MVKEARRGLAAAEDELSYTVIRAPFPGVVVKCYRHLGDFASAGSPVLSMYNPELMYATANLEETRLPGVAPGNPVTLHVDAFPRPFRGRVVWINKSTGAQFALMPRNVVSGEFTKVVQRVPVRIWIEKDDRWPQLQAGLSVRAVIDHGPGDPEWAKKAAQEFADLESRYSGPQEQQVGSHDTDAFHQFQEEHKMLATKDQVFEKVKLCLVDALGVEEEDIKPDATLVGDLGAESIDFLDIVFRLEKAFDIKISRGELFPEDVLTGATYVQDGRVNELGLAELRKRIAICQPRQVRREPARPGFRQPAHRRRHVPVRREQVGTDETGNLFQELARIAVSHVSANPAADRQIAALVGGVGHRADLGDRLPDVRPDGCGRRRDPQGPRSRTLQHDLAPNPLGDRIVVRGIHRHLGLASIWRPQHAVGRTWLVCRGQRAVRRRLDVSGMTVAKLVEGIGKGMVIVICRSLLLPPVRPPGHRGYRFLRHHCLRDPSHDSAVDELHQRVCGLAVDLLGQCAAGPLGVSPGLAIRPARPSCSAASAPHRLAWDQRGGGLGREHDVHGGMVPEMGRFDLQRLHRLRPD